MRRRTPIAAYGVVAAGAFIAASFAGVPAGAATASTTSGPSAASLPIISYYHYPDPSITPTSVTLAQPASTTVGKPVTISGTLLIGGLVEGYTSIEITRTGGGQPPTTFAANVRVGQFTWIDYPPAAGTFTYTANYAATATTAASSASVSSPWPG
jgi:hypothetical protein